MSIILENSQKNPQKNRKNRKKSLERQSSTNKRRLKNTYLFQCVDPDNDVRSIFKIIVSTSEDKARRTFRSYQKLSRKNPTRRDLIWRSGQLVGVFRGARPLKGPKGILRQFDIMAGRTVRRDGSRTAFQIIPFKALLVPAVIQNIIDNFNNIADEEQAELEACLC